MKQRRFSTELIVRILRETDQDSLAVVAKRPGVSDATSYIWRKKFGQLNSRFGPLADAHIRLLLSAKNVLTVSVLN
jgi:transposase-like protein